MDTKQEITPNSTKKIVKIDYIAYLAKSAFVREIFPKIKDRSLVEPLTHGSILILDCIIKNLSVKTLLELDLNIIKYMAYFAASVYLRGRKAIESEQELYNFLTTNLFKYSDNLAYSSKIDALQIEIGKIAMTASIDIDIVTKIIGQNFNDYLQKELIQDKALFYKIFRTIFAYLITKISLYHFTYDSKQLNVLINQVLITASFLLNKKIINWDAVKSHYEKLYQQQLSDDEKNTFDIVDVSVKDLLTLIKNILPSDKSPFFWVPTEIHCRIAEYLLPSDDQLLQAEAYSDLLRFAQVSTYSHRIVHEYELKAWKEILQKIVNTKGFRTKEPTPFLTGYDRVENVKRIMPNIYPLPIQNLIKDVCYVMKKPSSANALVKNKNNVVLQHFYLQGIIFKKTINNMKANDDNVNAVGDILRSVFESMQKNDMSGLFVMLELLDEILAQGAARFMTKARGIIMEKTKFEMNARKAAEFIEAYLQTLLAKAAGFVFNEKVPDSFDFNLLQPWILALAYDPIRGAAVFRATYQRMLNVQLTKAVCLSLSQCKDPHGVLTTLIRFKKCDLLEAYNWQADTLKILDTLKLDEVEFFFKFYTLLEGLNLGESSLAILSKTKEIFRLRSYIAEKDILYVCSKPGIYLKKLCQMTPEQLPEINKFKTNFLLKYPDAVQPQVHVSIFICAYNLQEVFLSSNNVPELLKLTNVNELFKSFAVDDEFAKKLSLLLSNEGLQLINLFQVNPGLVKILEYEYSKLECLLHSNNEKLFDFLRAYQCEIVNSNELNYLLSHPSLFIEGKITFSALNTTITGERRSLLRDFPGRFEHLEGWQVKKLFSIGSAKMSESIFDNNVLSKIRIFMNNYSEKLIYEHLEILVKENIFDFINQFTIESFLCLYKKFNMTQIVELRAVNSIGSPLQSLIHIPKDRLTQLLEAFEYNFEQIKIIAGSTICKMFAEFSVETLVIFYKKLGIKVLEHLMKLSSIVPNQNFLQTMLCSPSEKMITFIEESDVDESGNNLQILLNMVTSYKAFSGEGGVPQSLQNLSQLRGKNGFFAHSRKRNRDEENKEPSTKNVEDEIEEYLPRIKLARTEGNVSEVNALLKTLKNQIDEYLLQHDNKEEQSSENSM